MSVVPSGNAAFLARFQEKLPFTNLNPPNRSSSSSPVAMRISEQVILKICSKEMRFKQLSKLIKAQTIEFA